jgi:hypothetical protein
MIKKINYTNNDEEKIKKIPQTLFKELNGEGESIPELEKKIEQPFIMDKEQEKNKNKKFWHKKEIMNKKIVQILNFDFNSWPEDKQVDFVKKIAKHVSNLRKRGEILDLKYGYPRYGVWRVTTDDEKKAILGFKNGDYSCSVEDPDIIQETKMRQMINTLLDIYQRKCCVCHVKDQQNLNATPIIPNHIMRKMEPKNILNPTNRLLLCSLCEKAFNEKIITVDDLYNLNKTRKFLLIKEKTYLKKWIMKIENISKISVPSKFYPDKKYLNLKLELDGN